MDIILFNNICKSRKRIVLHNSVADKVKFKEILYVYIYFIKKCVHIYIALGSHNKSYK